MAVCDVCFRHCEISEKGTGFCGARVCRDGKVTAGNYGRITALALDPIEKKPLNRFYPGSNILSVGSYGCNLRCPFCQNHEISWSEQAVSLAKTASFMTPEELADAADSLRSRGNIGVAFTYNEPLIGYEFVRDAARLVKEKGMKNVIVTNGTAELYVLDELLQYVDAMNIDLKGFTDRYYEEVLSGSRKMVMDFIEKAACHCHVELTCLIVPGENDPEDEMREMTHWIAGLDGGAGAGAAGDSGDSGKNAGREIPLHISRFFPRFHMTDRPATDVEAIYHLADVAREELKYVYTGNC